MGSWRYQPVWTEDEGGKVFTLVEAHFDNDGRFDSWTEDDIAPQGETWEALSRDLNRMIVDAMCWMPVRRSDLSPGMHFHPRVSMEDRKDLADFVDEIETSIRRQPKPLEH